MNWGDIILFLVSPVFVESRDCREVEGRLAMERVEAEGAAGPCDCEVPVETRLCPAYPAQSDTANQF